MKIILKKISKKNWLLILFSIIFMVFEVYFDLKIPDKMSEMTTYVQMGNDDLGSIFKSGSKMMLYTAAGIASIIMSSILVAKFSSGFSATLRKEFFYKSQELSLHDVNRFTISSLITRATNDIVNIEMTIVIGILTLFKAPLLSGMAIYKIRNQDIHWSIITAISVVAIVIIFICALLLIYKKFISIQSLTDEVNDVSRESYNGLYTIRVFNFEKKRTSLFKKKNLNITKTEQFTDSVIAITFTLVNVILNLLTVFIYLAGTSVIKNASDEKRVQIFSDMLVYSTYAMQIINSFVMLMTVMVFLPRAFVSLKRVAEVLNTDSEVIDGSKNIEGSIYNIEFKNVSFKYPNTKDNVLSNINFSVQKGKTLAITGSTGSGKTSLVNLLMRFYDTTNGEILLNGINIKEYSIEELYNEIGYVPQNNYLFKGTITDNIAYAEEEVDEKELENVCRIAELNSLIMDIPDGLKSSVLRAGSNYSGGQKQRMALARALYKRPSVMVMDDSFSALDFKTDKKIRTYLKNEYKDNIKIIVSQRISTIIDADNILVLDDGAIIGSGNHNYLMNNCEQYRKFAEVQLNGGKDVEW